jgi:two-component sensor histidine kinase
LCRAQSLSFAHYTVESGLPSNTVYGITSDSKGFLWFCTDRGLCKYNGLRFQYYNFRDGISDNEIFFATEDKLGRLWFSTFNGDLCFYKDGVFHNEKNTPYLKLPFKFPYIKGICLHADSSVSFLFDNQQKFVTISKDRCHVYDLAKLEPNKLLINDIYGLTKLSASRYEIELTDESIVFDTTMHVIGHRPLRHGRTKLGGLYPCEYDSNGIYSLDGKLLTSLGKKWSLPRFFMKDQNHSLLGTFNGLILDNSLDILPHKKCSAIAKDINGDYWIATIGDGVYKIHSTILDPVVYKDVLPEKVIYASETDHGLLLGTSNNILLNMYNDSIKRLVYLPKEESDNPIKSLYYTDSLYNHYVFRTSDVIAIKNSSGKPVMRRYLMQLPLIFQWKSALRSGQKIYLRSPYNIHFWDFNEQKTKDNSLTLRKIKGHPNEDRIFFMTKDTSGIIWYTTLNHIYKIIDDSAVVQHQLDPLSFRWMSIEGEYMVGITHQNMLVICSDINRSPVIDTIQNTDCVWMDPYRLDQAHFIFSTNNAYRMLTLHATEKYPAYSLHAIDNPFIPGDAQVICADKKNCYLFKQRSIFRISLNALLQNFPLPRLFFSSVSSDNRRLYTNIRSGSIIDIPYNLSHDLKISFDVLSFYNKDVFFEYSFSDGMHDRWLPIQGEEINLLKPGYGTYVLKVRVRAAYSDNFSKPLWLQIHILKPFWAEVWFIVMVIVLGAGMFVLIIRLVLQHQIKKREQQHGNEIRILKSEYKALNALMNPHFVFNSLNSIQSLINDNNKMRANEYLNEFSVLIRQNMQNISHELIPLQKEIVLIDHYLRLEKLRFREHLNYKLEISDAVEMDLIMVPPLLIQPLVENAIKHGLLPRPSSTNMVTVIIEEVNEAVRIEVRDNGIGFQHPIDNKQHESMGLKSIRQRIEHLRQISGKNVTFELRNPDSSQSQTGVVVVITIDY